MASIKLAVFAIAALLLCGAAHAQDWTTTNQGGMQHYQSNNGWSGTGSNLGGMYQQQFYGPNGQMKTCTSSNLGGMVQTHCF